MPQISEQQYRNTHSKPPVLRIGITGGIGSGKSRICKCLEAAGHHVFYTDDVAKRIIRTHPEVKNELKALVGSGVYDSEDRLVKSELAAYLTRGREFSRRVDAVVHPRVAEAFLRLCAEKEAASRSALTPDALSGVQALFSAAAPRAVTVETLAAIPPSAVVFMECALLFEARFDRFTDISVLVHVSPETQMRRLMARDGISREKALAWMALQLDEDEKMRRADYLIDNEPELSVSE